MAHKYRSMKCNLTFDTFDRYPKKLQSGSNQGNIRFKVVNIIRILFITLAAAVSALEGSATRRDLTYLDTFECHSEKIMIGL